ncbi:alpha-methylacyl-CoA racemase, partial [Phenoliferia sp. Uapishka_3]
MATSLTKGQLAGLAPGPFGGMVLADFGADVVRVDPVGVKTSSDVLSRGKRSISLSLKDPRGLGIMRTMLSAPTADKSLWRADVLIDPFRPGVLERLGLSPDVLIEANPGLIIARVTGFRRKGPYSKMAGHDVNYVALSGLLSMMGRKGEKPIFPLNILGDFAGGGLMAALGILMAVIERNKTGKGQVVEVDMITGARYLSSFVLMLANPSYDQSTFARPRGENLLDGGAPFYEVYETADGKFMSLGALEPKFYAEFLSILLSFVPPTLIPSPTPTLDSRANLDTWPTLRSFFTSAFLLRTRDEWTSIFIGTDSCCVPVLSPLEVDANGLSHIEPGSSVSKNGSTPVPTPRLSVTPANGVEEWQEPKDFTIVPGRDSSTVLREVGLGGGELKTLVKEGVVGTAGRNSKL